MVQEKENENVVDNDDYDDDDGDGDDDASQRSHLRNQYLLQALLCTAESGMLHAAGVGDNYPCRYRLLGRLVVTETAWVIVRRCMFLGEWAMITQGYLGMQRE